MPGSVIAFMPGSVIASIPSPSSSALDLGPFQLRAYGLMIALAVLAAVVLSRRRWAARGNDPDEIIRVATWAVPAGLIGARLYHVITDWKRFQDDGWTEAFAIWKGGLGIPGGMAAGIIVGLWAARRQGMDLGETLATVVPALPLAQAIGRLGNWFNQELFGAPTDLPWGLQIDSAHRPPQHLDAATFHPTFLYEALWNLGLCAVLLILDRRQRARRDSTVEHPGRPGLVLAVYALGYGLGRLWIEAVRVDAASLILGIRVNIWMSATLIIVSLAYLAWSQRRLVKASDEAA